MNIKYWLLIVSCITSCTIVYPLYDEDIQKVATIVRENNRDQFVVTVTDAIQDVCMSSSKHHHPLYFLCAKLIMCGSFNTEYLKFFIEILKANEKELAKKSFFVRNLLVSRAKIHSDNYREGNIFRKGYYRPRSLYETIKLVKFNFEYVKLEKFSILGMALQEDCTDLIPMILKLAKQEFQNDPTLLAEWPHLMKVYCKLATSETAFRLLLEAGNLSFASFNGRQILKLMEKFDKGDILYKVFGLQSMKNRFHRNRYWVPSFVQDEEILREYFQDSGDCLTYDACCDLIVSKNCWELLVEVVGIQKLLDILGARGAFVYAVGHGDILSVQELLQLSAESHSLIAQFGAHWLCLAARHENQQLVDLLLENGASADEAKKLFYYLQQPPVSLRCFLFGPTHFSRDELDYDRLCKLSKSMQDYIDDLQANLYPGITWYSMCSRQQLKLITGSQWCSVM